MPAIEIPVIARTQQDFLDLLERLLPAGYLEPLKDPGPGYELLQAFAAMYAKVSKGVEIAGQDAQILTAASGAKATGTVRLSRSAPHPDGIAVTVKVGSVVTTSVGGRDFATTVDVVFGPTDLGPFTVPVEAISVGYDWNVRGETVAASGELLPGDIDTVKVLVEVPDYGDVTIVVYQATPTAGGADAALDGLGGDRGMLRLNGESDDAYRSRQRTLPDTVSPAALRRAIAAILEPVHGSYDFIETFEQVYQACWDAPSTVFAGSLFNPNLFVFDDPRLSYPFCNRWLDENDFRGGVIVVVEALQPLRDTGMIWDDTNTSSLQYVSSVTGGLRACGVFDMTSTIATQHGYLEGAWDGFDLSRQSLYKGLYETLQAAKPAGVSVAVELRGQ
jgi:hypothetical protein